MSLRKRMLTLAANGDVTAAVVAVAVAVAGVKVGGCACQRVIS